MADEQNVFTGTVNQFTANTAQRRKQLESMYAPVTSVQMADGSTNSAATDTPLPNDVNPYNVNVINELVKRNRPDVAQANFPYEYKALYGDKIPNGFQVKSDQQTGQPMVTIYGADGKPKQIQAVGASSTYDPNNWTFDNKKFSVTSLQQEPSAEDKAMGERLRKSIDRSQVGAINASSNTNGYKMFNNDQLLPMLFARRYGMLPEEVLALNPYTREEQARYLMRSYYDTLEPEYKQQIDAIGVDNWIGRTLKHYGIDEGSIAEDGMGTAVSNFASGVWEGVTNQFGNYGEGISTIIGAESSKTPEEIAKAKAEEQARVAELTPIERAGLQRFEELVEGGRYEDAISFVLSTPSVWGPLSKTTIGAMLADYAVTNAAIGGASAVGSLFTGGTAAAAGSAVGAAANTAKTLKWIDHFKAIANSGNGVLKAIGFGGVSGLGATGQLAKELKLDGEVLDPGSEAYNALLGYGLLSTLVTAIPGTLENQIAKAMMKKGASEELAVRTSQQVRSQLEAKGYKFTADGVVAPSRLVPAIKWGLKRAKDGAVESGTEMLQGVYGETVKQAAKGSEEDGELNFKAVDKDKVFNEGVKQAIPALFMGTAGSALGGLSTLPESSGTQKRNIAAGEKAVQDEAAYREWLRGKSSAEIQAITGDALQAGSVDRRAVDEALYQAWLYETVQDDAVAEEPKEEFKMPETFDIDLGDIANDEVYLQRRNNRRIAIATEFGRSGAQHMVPDESPVKDIRQFNSTGSSDTKLDVDAVWKHLEGKIEAKLNSRQNANKNLTENINTAQKYQVNEHMPESERAERLRLRDEQIALADAEQAKINNLRRLLRQVNTGSDVDALLAEAIEQQVFDYKDVGVANTMRSMLANQATYNNVGDSFSRFSDRDRTLFVEMAKKILDDAGIPVPPSLDETNLANALQTAYGLIDNTKYSGSLRAQQARKKLDVLNTALKTNLPETLYKMTNKALNIVANTAKVKTSPLWSAQNDPQSGALIRQAFNKNALLAELEHVLKTIKGKNGSNNESNILDRDTLADYKSLTKENWESNPEGVLEDVYTDLSNQRDQRQAFIQEYGDINQLSARDPSKLSDVQLARKDIATINGAMSLIMEMRKNFTEGKPRIAPKRNSANQQYMQIGSTFYDPLVAKIPTSEIIDYVANIKAIAKAFNLTTKQGNIPNIESDLIGHIDSLVTELTSANTPRNMLNTDRYKNSAAKATAKDEIMVKFKALTYLTDVAKRLKAYRDGKADMTKGKVELNDGSFSRGLLEAVLVEDQDSKSGAINEFLRAHKENLDVTTRTKVEQNLMDRLIEELVEKTEKENPVKAPEPVAKEQPKEQPVNQFKTGTAVVPWVDSNGKISATKPTEPVIPVGSNGVANVIDRSNMLPGETVQDFLDRRSAEDADIAQEEALRPYREAQEREQRKQRLYELAWQALGGTVKDGVFSDNPSGIIRVTAKTISIDAEAAFKLFNVANQEAGGDNAGLLGENLRIMLGALNDNNPSMFPEDSFDFVVHKLTLSKTIVDWKNKDTNKRTSKEVESEVRNIVGEINNHLLARGFGPDGVLLSGDLALRAFIGKLAEAYRAAGYDNLANMVGKAITEYDPNVPGDAVFNNARNVTIKAVDTNAELQQLAKTDAEIYGYYDPTTNTIMLSKEDQDIANTLMHELQHAVLSDVISGAKTEAQATLDAEASAKPKSRSKKKTAPARVSWSNTDTVIISGKRNKSGNSPVAEQIGKVVTNINAKIKNDPTLKASLMKYNLANDDKTANDLLKEAQKTNKRSTNPRWVTPAHIDELIVLGLDRARGGHTGEARKEIEYLLEAVFGETFVHPDNLARKVLGWLYDGKTDTQKQMQQSPVASGDFKHRRKINNTNQFKNPPNPDKKSDRTTVYHFGFEESNTEVTADPMAWFDGNTWNFYYVDQHGQSQRTRGMSYTDVMTKAQALGLHIDQREKDLMLKDDPTSSDQFSQFSPGVAKMWRGINRIFFGTNDKVSPIVRTLMNATQKWAVEQHGIDQFFQFYENTLTHVTGTDHEGKLQTAINRTRSRINHQITNLGVNGEKTMHELRLELENTLRDIGWSKEKVDNVLYSMRAGDYQAMIMQRSPNDPRWKTLARDPDANLSGFKYKDPTDPKGEREIDDPDGSKYWASLSAQDKKIANELRKLVTRLNDSVLQVERAAGRISEKQYQDSVGKFYVPLRNETDEATAFQRRAVGRTTKADSPLTHLIANHRARLQAAEQSMIYSAFMDLMEQHPVKGFATFNSSTLKNTGEGEYAMSADGFLEGNSVTFYRNGEKVTMTIQHKALADALKKRGEQHHSAYLDGITKVTGFLGLVRTATPTFMKTAFLRDMGMSFFNVQAAFRGQEKDFSATDWLGLGTRTLRDMVRYAPMLFKARLNPEKADWVYRVYRSEGGIGKVTGYDVEGVRAGLERDVFETNSVKNMFKKGAEKYLDVLHMSDDAARFSVWINYLQMKHGSPFTSEAELANFLKSNKEIADKARNASKNITGNFEQRGMARWLRSHFMFWNAINAGMRTFYGMLNPKYGKYGITSLSFLVAGIIAGVGGSDERDEDGKLKDSRMKNLGNVLRFGDAQVPVAQELRPAIHLANSIRFLMDGTWTWEEAFNHTVDGFVQAIGMFTPAQTGSPLTDVLYAVTPTLVQPVVLQVADKTYFGGDLTPTPYDSQGRKMEDAPNAFRSSVSTSDTSNWVTQNLYNLTGGRVDVAPNSLDMWAQQALGGVMSIAKHYVNSIEKGESVPEATMSLFAKGHTPEYNAFALQDETEERFKKAMTNFRISEDNQLLGKDHAGPEYAALKALYDQMKKELKAQVGPDSKSKMSDLQQQLKQLKASSSPSPDEFIRLTSAIEELGNKRNAIYGKYNLTLLDMGY